jgi:ribose 5-phosphate isomerase B
METLKNIKNLKAHGKRVMMRIGIATDFGWFELKRKLIEALNAVGYELTDIGDYELVPGENYPDFVVPLRKSNSGKNESQNLVKWKNDVEACKAVNKIPGVCAVLVTEPFASCREAEEEDLYVRCVGGQIKGYALSRKKVMTFLNADSPTIIPTNQRLAKVRVLGRGIKMAERENYIA